MNKDIVQRNKFKIKLFIFLFISVFISLVLLKLVTGSTEPPVYMFLPSTIVIINIPWIYGCSDYDKEVNNHIKCGYFTERIHTEIKHRILHDTIVLTIAACFVALCLSSFLNFF